MDEDVIRLISIGKEYKNNSMKYIVGQEVYDNHVIHAIVEEKECYVLYIKKNSDIAKWKSFNKNMAIGIEYDIKFE